MTLAEIRTKGGTAAVRKAITKALAAHSTATAAAKSLGTRVDVLRRAYERAGGTWPTLPRGRPRRVPTDPPA